VKRVTPQPLVGCLLNPLGRHARSIDFRDQELTVHAGSIQRLHLKDLAATPSVEKGLLGSTLSITSDGGNRTLMRGVRIDQATSFANTVRASWFAHNTAQFEAERISIDEVLPIMPGMRERVARRAEKPVWSVPRLRHLPKMQRKR
jgi:DNA helicase-4